jgi:short-subunit dehydrogenase
VGSTAERPLAIDHAAHWGLGRTIALEHPDVWGGLIDLDGGAGVDASARLVADELLAPDGEDQIAFRGDARHVVRLSADGADTASAPGDRRLAIDASAAYLVTGGLGALGHHVAKWLARAGAHTIVLASRRGGHSPGTPEIVRDLESAGVRRVLVVQADLGRESDVDALLAEIASAGAPLRGIVHAAGLDTPARLLEITDAQLESALEGKALGAWWLYQKTREHPLDFLVFFSSVSSVFGAPLRAHYAAANASLDALAHEGRRVGRPTVSVNWGPWRGGGMANDDDLLALERAGNRGLDADVALDALDAVAASDRAQVVVSDIDWPLFRATFEARRPRPLLAELAGRSDVRPAAAAPGGDWAATILAAPVDHQLPTLAALVRTAVATTLGFAQPEQVPVDQSVFELGLDSLRAVELSVRLQRHLALAESLPFFDCPDVTSMSARLLARFRSQAGEPEPGGERAVEAAGYGAAGYAPEIELEIAEFAKAAWPTRPQSSLVARWRWMFVEAARRRGAQPYVWIYRENGALVGHHGAIPVQLTVGDDTIDTGWYVDTVVLEGHRSRATGARLLLDSNDVFPIGLSLGQTDHMRRIALRLGWVEVSPLQVLVLLLHPHRVLADKLNPVAARVVAAGMSGRQRVTRLVSGPRPAVLAAHEIDRFDARHDALWASIRHEYGCAVTRDASYLNWKYVDQPGQHFVRFGFESAGRLVAVTVVALDAPGAIYRYRRLFLVDLVVAPSDASVVAGVLDHVRDYGRAAGADSITFNLINPALERIAVSYGFMRRASTRYLLVDAQRTSAEVRARVLSPAGWLITMGDSDIDRPWDVQGRVVQERTPQR